MYGRELLGVNRVERAEQIQFAVGIGRRVAQNRHLNVHPGTMKTRIPRICTNKLHPLNTPKTLNMPRHPAQNGLGSRAAMGQAWPPG
jgi:hypothetical protein